MAKGKNLSPNQKKNNSNKWKLEGFFSGKLLAVNDFYRSFAIREDKTHPSEWQRKQKIKQREAPGVVVKEF